MTAGHLGPSISMALYNELERYKQRYLILRDGGDDVPDIDWLMEMSAEDLDKTLDKIIAEREAKEEL